VDFCPASSPRGGGMIALARQRSRSLRAVSSDCVLRTRFYGHTLIAASATFAKASRKLRDLAITTCNRCASQRAYPDLAPKRCSRELKVRQAGEGRNRSGQPAALTRSSEVVPAGSATIIRQAQKRLRFLLKLTLDDFVAPRNRNRRPTCAEAVDVETCLWKREEI
jgi:hypothetical protein